MHVVSEAKPKWRTKQIYFAKKDMELYGNFLVLQFGQITTLPFISRTNFSRHTYLLISMHKN